MKKQEKESKTKGSEDRKSLVDHLNNYKVNEVTWYTVSALPCFHTSIPFSFFF